MKSPPELTELIDLWFAAAEEFVEILEVLETTDWKRPTDLVGWDVHAVAAHIAHIESMLAGHPQHLVDFETPPHVTGPFGRFMESGVVARRGSSPDQLIAEIQTATTQRYAALQAEPGLDPRDTPDILPPGLRWDLETLMNNRIIDLWMHQQDVRRAVGRPGNLESATAAHSMQRLGSSLGFVVGKKVGAAPGTSVLFEIGGQPIGILIDERGRGQFVPPADEPDVRITLTAEEFVTAAGGRRPINPEMSGNAELGARILAQMAVTP